MRLTVVGCSGSFPGPAAAASCYLVEAADSAGRTWRVLLDLGNGALGPLQHYAAPADLDAVLLTHLHPDHCLDLCGLYVALRYNPSPAPSPIPVSGGSLDRLPVYGPTGTLEHLDRAYGDTEPGGLGAVFEVHEWKDGERLEVGPIAVTARRVEHPVEAFGLRLEHAGAVLAYTGDTDTCPALVPLAQDADLLLAEASFQEDRDSARGVHLTGRRAGELAGTVAARRLVLTHLPVWNDPDVVLAEARGAYSGSVALARPGDVHELGRP